MGLIAPVRNRPVYRPMAQTDFGGLATQDAPLIPRRNAIISENVSYDSRQIVKAKGDRPILENAVGAVLIEGFNSNTGWTGGALETESGKYVVTEPDGEGVASRLLSQAGVGTATMEKTYDPPLVLGLPPGNGFDEGFDEGFGADEALVERPLDLFHIWRMPVLLQSSVTSYQCRLQFESSTGNYYEAVLFGNGQGEETLDFVLGSEFTDEFDDSFGGAVGIGLYRRIRRFEFSAIGSPSWESISKIRIELEVLSGAGTIAVVFDNLYRSPGYVQDLFQFRRFESPLTRSRSEYAVAGGKLWINDGKRWSYVFQGFDAERQVNGITIDERRFLTDGSTSPQKIMPDGSVYRMGIKNPPKQITLSQITGGGLADQNVFVKIQWFSTITGIESGVDDHDVGTKLVISSGGGSAGVRVSNLPTDPRDAQVTHLRIFIRPENLSDDQFFRASGHPDGEVEVGTTSFDILETVTNLENFEVMEPDSDYPSVVDAQGVQSEGHPLFFGQIGAFAVTVMAEQPGTLRFSLHEKPESWPLDAEVALGIGDDDEISGISSGKDVGLVFTRDAIYPVKVVNAAIGPIAGDSISNRGTVSHKAITRIHDQVWFPGEDGVYWINASLAVRSASDDAQKTWNGFWERSQMSRMVGAELRNHFQYHLFGHSQGSRFSERTWVTHYPRSGRLRQRLPSYDPSIYTTGADAVATVEDSQDLHRTWIAREGMVYQLDEGFTRDGRPYTMRHKTGIWSPDMAGAWVSRWRWLDVDAVVGGDQDLLVNAFIGTSSVAHASPAADLQGSATVLGSFTLGTSRLGAGAYVHQKLKLQPKRARWVQFEFSHSGNGPCEILAARVYYLPITQKGVA